MIFINDVAYNEFIGLLNENNVKSYNIRINIGGYSCQGPVFDVLVSEPTPEDDIVKIKDITFIIEKSLLEDYGGFIIVSSEENNGHGVGLKPVVLKTSNDEEGCNSSGCNSGGCGGCNGGCH